MKPAPDISAHVSMAVELWLAAPTCVPLIIRKEGDGVVCVQALPKQRYTKGEFAEELRMGRNTFAKLEKRYALAPAKSDGCYDRETVEDVKRWLRDEETRRPPAQRRRA